MAVDRVSREGGDDLPPAVDHDIDAEYRRGDHAPDLLKFPAERILFGHHPRAVEEIGRLGDDRVVDPDGLGVGRAGQDILQSAVEAGP